MSLDTEVEERSSLESILEYTHILWHWAWLLILAAVIAGAAAYYLTNQQTRIYEATTLAMVNAASGSSVDTSNSLYVGQMLATTYTNTMLTQPVMQGVSQRLGFEINSDEIKVQPITGTSLIRVTVTDEDPVKAALIANTVVSVFSEQVLVDQTSRYTELKISLEEELTNMNNQIADVQERLAIVTSKLSEPIELDPANPTIIPTMNPVDLLEKSQLESTLTQHQQSRTYFIQSLQQVKLAEAQSTSSLIQKDPAVPDFTPVQPQPIRSSLLAGVVGLMLAAGIVFLIAFLEDEIRDPEEITRKWGIPILGLITNHKPNGNTIITMSQPRSPVSEAYRSLRTNLQFSGIDNPLKTILVTSASPSDGKTSVVANLATVMAQNSKEVVVVDSDLRRPRIHKIFSLSNRIGLSDYFIRPSDQMAGVMKSSKVKGLSVITSGSLPPNPSELLNTTKMVEVIKKLGTHFDIVILDTPPLLAVTDALVLAPRVDGVILVIDPVKTKRGALRHAIEQLQQVKANLLGVVLNNVRINRSQYYYNRNYYYGKSYGVSDGEPLDPDVRTNVPKSKDTES